MIIESNGYQILTVTVNDRKGVLIKQLEHTPNHDFIIFDDEPDKSVKDPEVLKQAKFEGEFVYKQDEKGE